MFTVSSFQGASWLEGIYCQFHPGSSLAKVFPVSSIQGVVWLGKCLLSVPFSVAKVFTVSSTQGVAWLRRYLPSVPLRE